MGRVVVLPTAKCVFQMARPSLPFFRRCAVLFCERGAAALFSDVLAKIIELLLYIMEYLLYIIEPLLYI